jgi:hypothetical protein
MKKKGNFSLKSKKKICIPKDLRFSMDVDIKGEVFRSIVVIKYKLKVVMKGKKRKEEGKKGKEKINL